MWVQESYGLSLSRSARTVPVVAVAPFAAVCVSFTVVVTVAPVSQVSDRAVENFTIVVITFVRRVVVNFVRIFILIVILRSNRGNDDHSNHSEEEELPQFHFSRRIYGTELIYLKLEWKCIMMSSIASLYMVPKVGGKSWLTNYC